MLAFKQHLLKTINNKYTILVLEQFCSLGLNEDIALENRIEHIPSMIRILEKLQELDKYSIVLEDMQKKLFTAAQNQKNNTMLQIAVAMNTLIKELRKDCSKNNSFYIGIQATIEFMRPWEEKLQEQQKEVNQIESKKRKESTFFTNLGFTNKQQKVNYNIPHETETKEDRTEVSMNQKNGY